MLHNGAFHLGLHCLPKYLAYRGLNGGKIYDYLRIVFQLGLLRMEACI